MRLAHEELAYRRNPQDEDQRHEPGRHPDLAAAQRAGKPEAARAAYERAETDRINAIYDYHRAYAALENAVGRPLR